MVGAMWKMGSIELLGHQIPIDKIFFVDSGPVLPICAICAPFSLAMSVSLMPGSLTAPSDVVDAG